MDWSEKLVLIAEDEETNFLLLCEYLEPTGIKVVQARNGLEVMEICKKLTPDVILLDMKMPKMSGFEVLTKFKEQQYQVPVIAQTAFTMVGDKEKILAMGCTDYIPKPIDEMGLIKKLSKYLVS